LAEEAKPAQPEEQPEEVAVKKTAPPNHIYIGKKPLMTYAMSALIQLAQSGEVVLKARGMVISRAVDVSQIIVKRLGQGAYEIKDVKIDTEQVGSGDTVRNVSTIEIVVGRK